MIYDPFDVVVVPFPFTDKKQFKRRPALVLSAREFYNSAAGHVVLAMITSVKNNPWPGDVRIHDLKIAGIRSESVVRMKLFTLDERLILQSIGKITGADRQEIKKSFSRIFREIC